MKGDVHLPHPGEGRTRWCSGCAGLHVGAVDTRGKKFTDANSNVDQLGASGSSPASGSSLPHPPAVDPPPTPPGPPRGLEAAFLLLLPPSAFSALMPRRQEHVHSSAQFIGCFVQSCSMLSLASGRPPLRESKYVYAAGASQAADSQVNTHSRFSSCFCSSRFCSSSSAVGLRSEAAVPLDPPFLFFVPWQVLRPAGKHTTNRHDSLIVVWSNRHTGS